MIKRIFFLLISVFLSVFILAQNLGNPQTIGQTTRNQKVGKGFQVEDTLLAKGLVRITNLSNATSNDTNVIVANSNGIFYKIGKQSFLSGISSGGGTTTLQYFVRKTQADTLKINHSLVGGASYMLTDFATIYDQPDFESDGTPKATVVTKTAPIEHLVFIATSDSTFSNVVNSVEFPNDKIEFDWNYTITEVMNAPAKGRISYRLDDNLNSADYDFRKVLLKRYESSTGSGIFNQWKDNGEASQEFLTFGNNYEVSALIKLNKIEGISGVGNLFGYPFLICNIVIDGVTSALENNLYKASRNCHFGDGLNNADLFSANNCIVGTDVRNFKNKGNIQNVITGNNINSLGFFTAVVGFTIGDNCTNIQFMHSINNVVIGSDNNNWTCQNEIVNLTADNDLSNINNLNIGNYIDGSGWTNFITTTTQPDMYNNTFKKEIFKGSDNNVYWRYFNGATDLITIID